MADTRVNSEDMTETGVTPAAYRTADVTIDVAGRAIVIAEGSAWKIETRRDDPPLSDQPIGRVWMRVDL